MKSLLLKSLMIGAVLGLTACDNSKKEELSDGSEMQTTTPHAMETEPVQPTDLNNNHMHDDMNSPASEAYAIENDSSGVTHNASTLPSTTTQSSAR